MILFEHEKLFYQEEFRKGDLVQYVQKARDLFSCEEFNSCFLDGLQSESAFVRYHYIIFVRKLIPLMQKVLPTHTFIEKVVKMIECFCKLLRIADVSAYESNVRAGKTIINDKSEDDEIG